MCAGRNRATATGNATVAYAGASENGVNTNGNTATAFNGGFASAGGDPEDLVNLTGNSGNTAISTGNGSGDSSFAIAGSLTSGDSGYTATAGPGQTVCNPTNPGC
jgi:hypothetical protein